MASSMFADLARPMGPLESVERLRILETLSYGLLYEGRVFQASRAEEVALLELDSAFDRDPETFERVLVQLLAASRLRDPSLFSPRGVFRHGDSLYVLFDGCAGLSLSTAFDFLGRAGLRLSSEAVLRVAGGVLAALDLFAPHEAGQEDSGGCHGLITPENVFIAEGQRVLVRGVGLWAAGIHRLGLLGPNERRYLAPSQNRSGGASQRSDLLALGTILFEGVAGAPAFDVPPEEDDLAQLRISVGELQEKAETPLRGLYEIVLACLMPPAVVTSAYRARVRKTIDTLFLQEFTRDRAAKTLSLDDLVGRVKPRRPTIVRATSISLAQAEAEPHPRGAEKPNTTAPGGESVESEDVSTISVQAPPFLSEPSAAPPSPPVRFAVPPTAGTPGRRISSPLIFGGAAVAIVLFVTLFWSSWPRPEHGSGEGVSSARPERPVIRPAPSPSEMLPSPGVPVSTQSEIRPPHPGRSATGEPERPAAPESTARSRAPASAKGRLGRRAAEPAMRPAGPTLSSAPPEANRPVPGLEAAHVPAVVPGALVPLDTAGLVSPVLVEKPPAPRYQESDPRPAVERTALLEILVSDSGRVRGSRILRVDRLPLGFSGGLEKYLAAVRFRPAEFGGVAVKVWIPYELRYYAP